MNNQDQFSEVIAENARLSLILESTTEGWWEWDASTDQTYHSPNWYKMLGYSPDELPSSFEMWASLIHPDDRDKAISGQAEQMQKKDRWEISFRMKTRQHGYIWILSKGRVVSRDQAGNAMKVVGIHLDITEKMNFQQLREEKEVQEELMQGIIRVSHSSFKIYDFVSQKFLFNAGNIYALLGYEKEEFMALLHEFTNTLVHPKDLPVFRKYIANLKETTTSAPQQLVFRMKAKNGRYHWITTQDAVFRRDEKGNPTQVIGSAIDITARRELEDKMEKHIRYLEDLSYKNSHELRGPVATLLGLTHLLLIETGKESIAGKMVSYLERTVKKLDEVIGKLNEEINSRTSSGK